MLTIAAAAGHEPRNNPTNELLRGLLASIGIESDSPSLNDDGTGSLFFTNAILCLKTGGLQAKIKPDWFINCRSRFLKPSIEIVQPRVLVTLGERHIATLASCTVSSLCLSKMAVEHDDGVSLGGRTRLFPVYHCGARILNTHRPKDKQMADWARIGRVLRVGEPAGPSPT